MDLNIVELKEAHKQYLKIYREQNKDNIKKSFKKWYESHKDDPEVKQKRKEYKAKIRPKKEKPELSEQEIIKKQKKAEYNKRYQEKKKLKII